MVKRHRAAGFPALVGALLIQHTMIGCSLKNHWGEKPKTPQIIESTLESAECPPIQKIVTAAEAVSNSTFQCWSEQIEKIWTQVYGKKKDTLSEAEIATLIRKQILRVPGDTEQSILRIFAIKRLLGFPRDLRRDRVEDWVHWAKAQRSFVRSLYEKIHAQTASLSYIEIEKGIQVLSTVLKRMNLVLSSDELAQTIITAFDIQDSAIQKALIPGSDVALNAVAVLCPTLQQQELWNTPQIGQCLDLLLEKFRPGAPWFEFLVQPIHELSPERITQVRASLRELSVEVKNWFNSPKLSPIYPTRWLDFSRKMGAHPPSNLLDSLRVIRRLKTRSNEEIIYPEGMIRIFAIIRNTQEAILDGIPSFVEATLNHQCQNPSTTYWTECILKNYENEAERSPAIKVAWRVKNFHHGQTTVPLNGKTFSKISLFYELAGQAIALFHDDCPPDSSRWKTCNPNFITSDIGDENDHLAQLITVGVTSSETLDRFIKNIKNKINRRPFEEDDSIIDQKWNISGLARLIAMASDLFVKRTTEESNLLSNLMSMLVLPNKSSVSLDQLAITAILENIDSLTHYRETYLELLGNPPPHDLKPKDVIHELNTLLHETFPRTYESCSAFGFDQSCKLAFQRLLPVGFNQSESISSRDLDLITITASALEGLIDSCDRDGDSRLQSNFFKGNDELDCGFIRTQEVIKRLIESRIVNISQWDQAQYQLLIWIINSTPFTRIYAKIAMSRGTTKDLLTHLLWPPFSLSPFATLGSIYSLIGTIGPTRSDLAH